MSHHNDTISNISTDFENFVTPWKERVSCSVLFSSTCVLGMITNGLVIFLTLYTDEIRKKSVNWLVANLSLSDFLCAAVFVLGQNFYILYREIMPSLGCTILAVFNAMAGLQVFVFPPILTINRYLSLYDEILFKKIYTNRNMILMVMASWAYSGVVAVGFAVGGHTGFDKRNEHCCLVVEGNFAWTVVFWATVTGPLLVLFNPIQGFCNYKIYKKVYTHVKDTERKLGRNVLKEYREILYLCIIDFIVPACSQTAYEIAKFLYLDRFPLASRQVFITIYLGTSAIRGAVIVWTLRPYRMAFQHFILRKEANKVKTSSIVPTTNSGPRGEETIK